MSSEARPAVAAEEFEASIARLARGSRLASILSLVGLLAVLAALVFSGQRLRTLHAQVSTLDRQSDSLGRQIDTRRGDLYALTDSLVRLRAAYSAYQDEVRRREPTLAATAATAARDSARAARIVYIQFRGSAPRALAGQMRAELDRLGYKAPGVERIDRDFDDVVRYFHAEDSTAAARLAREANGFLRSHGCPATLQVQNLSARGARVPQGQLEVWVNLECRG